MLQKYLIFLGFVLLVNNYQTSANANCEQDKTCVSTGQFEFHVTLDGDMIQLTWNFNNQSDTVFGFQVMIYDENEKNVYQSPLIHSSERKMNIEKELSGKSQICFQVYQNSTTVLAEKCEYIEVNDLKIVIGILAGVIFLIPCIIGISYVIYKDLKNNSIDYEELEKDSLIEEQLPTQASTNVEHEIIQITKKTPTSEVNLGFIKEDSPTECKCEKGTNKTHQCQFCDQNLKTEHEQTDAQRKNSSNNSGKTSEPELETDITDDSLTTRTDQGSVKTSASNQCRPQTDRRQSESDIAQGDLAGTNM